MRWSPVVSRAWRANEELVRKERLAAVGELAAVVAHEVRNPLAVVFNAVAALKKQGTERSKRPNGTGLGLAVVRTSAEAHDGSVTLMDTPGGGATFTLRFPRQPLA